MYNITEDLLKHKNYTLNKVIKRNVNYPRNKKIPIRKNLVQNVRKSKS